MVTLGVIAGLFFVGAFILQQGIFGTIINSDVLSEGTCQSKELGISITLECDIKNIVFNILSYNLATCQYINNYTLYCHTEDPVKYFHNKSGILTITTPFNHTVHAGKTLWVNTTCVNSSDVQDNIILKPCLSEFQTMAYHNNTHVGISCEHASYRYSNTGIRLAVDNGNDLAHCSWNGTNKCHGDAEALNNGLRYTALYTKGMNFTCKFDGQSVNFVPQLLSTINTTPSSARPTSSTPSSQSQENGSTAKDNGQTKVTSPSLMIFILCILYFLQRDVFI
ncbi:uncharacterized protein LOC134270481 isoform X1 [Saccostrea cucullata]|uniref:uncharacterized protein LOC134270481 isoform X1 n=1 Tax=Saccostrea cuccullata TaxID=36930 RepID=UPI002ECFF70C